MNGATSIPKSVLLYELDKGLYFDLVLCTFLNPLSKNSQKSKTRVKQFYCVGVVVVMNRCYVVSLERLFC